MSELFNDKRPINAEVTRSYPAVVNDFVNGGMNFTMSHVTCRFSIDRDTLEFVAKWQHDNPVATVDDCNQAIKQGIIEALEKWTQEHQ